VELEPAGGVGALGGGVSARVGDREGVTLEIEGEAGVVDDGVLFIIEAVVLDGEEGAAEVVEERSGGGGCVGCGLGRGVALGVVLVGAGGEGVSLGVPVALKDRVVRVMGELLPRGEGRLGKCAVGQVGADEATERVVVEERGDAPLGELSLAHVDGRGVEEGLVLLDGVALVVDDDAAGADPARERRSLRSLLEGVR
jgi:hypothetical protein